MITTGPGRSDEDAVRALLTAAVDAGPRDVARRPPTLGPLGMRARRLTRVRRARRAGAAVVAAVVVAGTGLAVRAHGADRVEVASPVPAGITWVTPSDSMSPTARIGDLLEIDRRTRTLGQLHRGDIIVFEDPGGWLPTPSDGSASWLVKRLIGLPGDRITCCDARGRLLLNGTPLAEPYLAPGMPPSGPRFDVTVRPGGLWVLGDNRSASLDSRFHQARDNEQVPLAAVVGKVTRVIPRGSAPSAAPAGPSPSPADTVPGGAAGMARSVSIR